MKIFRKVCIVVLVLMMVFFTSCKKKCHDKDDDKDNDNIVDNNNNDMPNINSSGEIILDSNGKLNYSKPVETKLPDDSKKELMRKVYKLSIAVQEPFSTDSVIDEKTNDEFALLTDEEINEVCVGFEKAGITSTQINKIYDLVMNNRVSLYRIYSLFVEGAMDLFDEKEFNKVMAFLVEIKKLISPEQLSFLLSSGLSIDFEYYRTIYFDGGMPYVEIKQSELVETIKELTNKYQVVDEYEDSDEESFQLTTMLVALLYQVIDGVNKLDRNEARNALQAIYEIDFALQGISEKFETETELYNYIFDNIKVIGKFVKSITDVISSDELKIFFKTISNVNEINYITLMDPFSVKLEYLYKLRPILEIVVNVTQNDSEMEILETKVQAYLDQAPSAEADLSIYVVELVIKYYDALSQIDKDNISSLINSAIPETMDYTFEQLYNTVKSILNNKELSKDEMFTELMNQPLNDLFESDKGGIIYRPSVQKIVLVPKGSTQEVTQELFYDMLVNNNYFYSAGQGEISEISKYDLKLVSYDNSTVGMHKATLQYNESTVEIEYYVYDSLENFAFTENSIDINTFVFAQNQSSMPLDYYAYSDGMHNIEIELYNTIYKQDITIEESVSKNDITFYNIDTTKLGYNFAYASYISETYGEVYFPICYYVVPTEKQEPINYYIYDWNLSGVQTKEQFVERTSLVAQYAFAVKNYETDVEYSYVSTKQESDIQYTIDNVKTFEFDEDGDLYIVIEYNGFTIEDTISSWSFE